MDQAYDYHLGVRLTKQDIYGLSKLVDVCGVNQSEIIRFLVRTAAQRPQMVASGIRKAKEQTHVG